MKLFAELCGALETTNTSDEQLRALMFYFQQAPAEDAVWAIRLLQRNRFQRLIAPEKLREWALETAAIPGWLFEESQNIVKDLIETVTLIFPPPKHPSAIPLHVYMEQKLHSLQKQDEIFQKQEIIALWEQMETQERFVWNTLLSGRLRISMPERMLVKALAQISGLEATVITYRLQQPWKPTPDWYYQLFLSDTCDAKISQPYPFYLACPLEDGIDQLGKISDWHVEWKWKGLRSQLVKRANKVSIWTKDEALMTAKFPELQTIAEMLPDGTVCDGIIVPWRNNSALPVTQLERRIQKKHLNKSLLQEIPIKYIAFDLLEYYGEDIRAEALSLRKQRLSTISSEISAPQLESSPEVVVADWAELMARRKESRNKDAGGLMLKRLAAPYLQGDIKGDWWEWNVEPLTATALLIYAQRTQGPLNNLYTEYTFAVRDGDRLVSFAKTGTGLSEAERQEIDQFIKQNTLDRFGPVRSVKPELVFEISFEDIQPSTRHKSGVTVRAPKIVCWRRDKKKKDVDTLEAIHSLL